jgi:signal transduction histidine kinase
MTPHSRRRQLLLGSLGLVTGLIVLLVAVLGFALHQQQYASMDGALLAELHEFQEIGEQSSAKLREELAVERAGFQLIALLPPDGAEEFYWGCTARDVAAFPVPASGRPTIVGSLRPGDGATPIRVGAVQLSAGRVYLGLTQAPAEAALVAYLEVAAIAIVVVLIALSLGLRALADRVFDPIARMTETARRISADRLGDRVPVGASGDELDRLATLLNEMLARLGSSFSALSEFTGNVSHELRTPLTTIRLTLENALSGDGDPAELRGALEQSLDELSRLEGLVATLLRLARSDGSGAAVETERVDLQALCRTTVESLAPVAEAAGVRMQVTGHAPVSVHGDPQQLRELLLALLENALRYTPSGGTVTAGCALQGDDAALQVCDDGPGVAPEDADRIFRPFERGQAAATAGDREGFGLGLAIAAGIARRHGGTLSYRNAEGGGATFALRLRNADR